MVTTNFKGVWIDRALIESVIEGLRPARVFVDNVEHLTAVLMCGIELGEYFIIGDSNQGPVRQFIKDMPSEAEVFNRERFAYFMPDASWESALLKDRNGAITIFPTRSFRYRKQAIRPLDEWRTELNRHAEVRQIDADLLKDVQNCTLNVGNEFDLSELERIFRDRFGFCVVVDNEIASVAYALNLSASYASVSIDTAEPFRRRGLATLACERFIEYCLEQGITPIWNCLESNIASGELALKLGMEEGPPQRESGWTPFQWQYETTSGLWAREDSSDARAVWRRVDNQSQTI
jgi:GNAT superfamily N-acetyltransferase